MTFRALARTLLTFAGLAIFTSNACVAAEPVRALETTTDHRVNEMVRMRDGAHLWTSIHFPKEMEGAAPVILIRTPYAFEMESTIMNGALSYLQGKGYIIVFQNERGRHWSEGEFHIIGNSANDGYDTVDWIARQPWSNGKVGTWGCSSSGDSQVRLASIGHPALKASIVMSAGSSVGELGPFHEQGAFYRGGAPQVPWWTWYQELGQGFYPKFPAGISEFNRDWLADLFRDGLPQSTADTDVDALVRHLPSMDAVTAAGGQKTEFEKLIRRLPNDPAWKKESFLNEGDPFRTPTLWVTQAFDIALSPEVAIFEYAHRNAKDKAVRENQHLLISGLGHCSMQTESEHSINGERDIGDARYPYLEEFTAWFDRWLKDDSDASQNRPAAEIYVSGANAWRRFPDWPAPGAHQISFYLDSAGAANTSNGDGRLLSAAPEASSADTFTYDPEDPTPTLGGDVCCVGGLLKPGGFDQSTLEMRKDVLVYTSAPLDEPLEAVGYVDAVIHVSSDAPDTDFTAKLVDVYPDGRAFNVGDSIQRVRWRDGYKSAHLMTSGNVYEVRIGPFFVANQFQAGHRIRLEIASANFPRYERNLNTGGNNFDESVGRIARNNVHHGAEHPSHVTLTVVPVASTTQNAPIQDKP